MIGWRLWFLLGALLLAGGGALYVGHRWSSLERVAAEATRRAEQAEALAAGNAAAATEAARIFTSQMAAVTHRAITAETERQALMMQLEALRADPSYSVAAAPVLGRAVDELRRRRRPAPGRDHGGHRAASAPGGAAASASASGARHAADAGPDR